MNQHEGHSTNQRPRSHRNEESLSLIEEKENQWLLVIVRKHITGYFYVFED